MQFARWMKGESVSTRTVDAFQLTHFMRGATRCPMSSLAGTMREPPRGEVPLAKQMVSSYNRGMKNLRVQRSGKERET